MAGYWCHRQSVRGRRGARVRCVQRVGEVSRGGERSDSWWCSEGFSQAQEGVELLRNLRRRWQYSTHRESINNARFNMPCLPYLPGPGRPSSGVERALHLHPCDQTPELSVWQTWSFHTGRENSDQWSFLEKTGGYQTLYTTVNSEDKMWAKLCKTRVDLW